MRRVLEFFGWHSRWWEARTTSCAGRSIEHTEGLIAYAKKQARIRQELRAQFSALWHGSQEIQDMGIGPTDDILDLKTAALIQIFEPPPTFIPSVEPPPDEPPPEWQWSSIQPIDPIEASHTV